VAYYPAILSPEYDKLIEQFRAWCKAAHGCQQKIADALRVSKQLVSGWLSGYRAISLDEWTQIQAVINEESAGTQFPEENKSMKTIVDPPAGTNPNFPKNLEEARLRIAFLNQEIAQLKGAAVISPAKPASAPATPTPAAKPTPAVSKPVAPASSTAMIINPRPVPNTAAEKLRVQLDTAPPEERDQLYRRLKEIESNTNSRAYRESRRK
jgi:hypothetical protein